MKKQNQLLPVGFNDALLSVLSNKTLDFIAVVNKADRKIEYVNEMGAKLFEFKKTAELIGRPFFLLRKEAPQNKDLRAIDEELASNRHYSAEAAFVTSKGNEFWGRMQLNLFKVEADEYILAQIEKIDRAIKAEKELLKEQLKFDALLEYASIAVIIVNQQQQILLMNNYAVKIFGYAPGEYKGRKIEMLIPARYHNIHFQHHKDYYRKPKSRAMGAEAELYAVKKGGIEFPVEVSLSPYEANNETYVIVFVNDITSRKNEENEVRRLNAELEAKVEERTDQLDITISKLKNQVMETEDAKKVLMLVMQFQKAVLDSSGALIIATDPRGIITLFNKASEELLGYKAVEVIGKFGTSIFHDVGETKKRAASFAAELNMDIKPGFETFVAKSMSNRENVHEWTFVKKNGECFPVSLTVTALRDEKNVITGYLYVAVDLSEIKRTETELLKSLEKEKELNELKSRFVSMASHEFRTPLSTILSSIYLLEKYTTNEDQPNREKHILRIASSVNMLTDILNDFLSVGKIEEGKIEPKFSQFNIVEKINNMVNEMTTLLKKGQQISYRHKGEEKVYLDPSLLNHIVMNLLSNAIKFSGEGSRIQIRTNREDSLLRLSIKDNGMGIPREDQVHLFERFFRGRNVTAIQGTGLGLHIMQKYTELMNGKVVCKSELDKGTEFIISFMLNI